ncbi:DUF1573 domain-containing protein [Marivirga sp. S37H4]|uniref:DUF1573 domain-containing protein n=1 Tax=Marivirga aurantiaca TaxID=2802615 RepID=A0A935C567_9BACT|nr:DUF1573 domain-containing protein [Marivirga aurantiaca]MBK6263681.1 DUF1573 domain-containing protein [Marivirga aurantiaca]
MKKLTFILITLFAVNFAIAQTADSKNGPDITFQETSHDFGDITQGDVVEHVFKFENTGNEPLILADVKTTCGCTAPSWPKEPISPGETAELTVKFNSRGKMGRITKVITVVSNIGENKTVKIVTNILPKES